MGQMPNEWVNCVQSDAELSELYLPIKRSVMTIGD